MRNARSFVGLFVVAFLRVFGDAFSQASERDDNLAVFQKLFDRAADRVTNQLSAARSDIVVTVPAGDPTSAFAMLRARAMKRALEAGHRVFDADSVAGYAGYIRIAFPLLQCKVEYANVRSGFLWRSGSVRRQITVDVDAEVTEQPSARVLVADSFRADFADTVRSSEIGRLEYPQTGFTGGRRPSPSLGSQVLEPLLLTISAGAAIYALYALRSR
jgi:hypothetical protein